MPRERKSNRRLEFTDYEIAGNTFRAWYDDSRLVLVLDETIDEYKPYTLLVLDSYDDRKWDDVLVNDFKLNLEDVRPRRDNKYQKLDIEYGGLDFYAQLIADFESGKDIDDALTALYDFRDAAVRRAATERLVSATEVIEQSERTAKSAKQAIQNLENRRRVLDARLEKNRVLVGRKPPKETAARILKVESQIEKNTDKINRAKKRFDNAVRRGDVARDDAAVARDILARRRPMSVSKKKDDFVPKFKDVPVVKDLPIPEYDEIEEETNTEKPRQQAKALNNSEPKAFLPVPDYENYEPEPQENKMPDTPKNEEVKPLLDENPEILDDEIAFKPVAFDDIKAETGHKESENTQVAPESYTVSENNTDYSESNETDNVPVARPLSFSETDDSRSQNYDVPEDYDAPEPVLNKIQSVSESRTADVDTTGQVNNTQYQNMPRPESPVAPVAAPAAAYGATRPISPITGEKVGVRPVGDNSERARPTVFYYFLLILLIALSVFTLWLYQKKNGGTVPFADNTAEVELVSQPDVIVGTHTVVKPEPEVAPEPVQVEPEPIIDPELIMDEEVTTESDKPIDVIYPNENVLRAAELEPTEVESEESVLSRKEPYGVSRDSQPVYAEPRVTNLVVPDVIFDDEVVSVPALAPGYTDDEELYYNENGEDMEYYPYDGDYYYEPEQYNESDYYQENDYIEDETTGGFVMDSGKGGGFLSVHDGGQYSVGYNED